jgi:hypothetical protein
MVGMNPLLAEVSFAMDKISTLIWIVPSEVRTSTPTCPCISRVIVSRSTSFQRFQSFEVFVSSSSADVQLQLRTLKHTELKLTGTGCTYRWFSTAEVCMILERFNTIVFVGDELVHSVYTAFNILLREDLALGGLQQWIMSDQDRVICKCDNQFLNQDCAGYAIKDRDEVKKNTGDQKGSPYFCTRKSFVTP